MADKILGRKKCLAEKKIGEKTVGGKKCLAKKIGMWQLVGGSWQVAGVR